MANYVATGYWASGYVVGEDTPAASVAGGYGGAKKKRKLIGPAPKRDQALDAVIQDAFKRVIHPEDFPQEELQEEISTESIAELQAKILADQSIADAKRNSEIQRLLDEDEDDVLMLLLA